MVTTKESNHSKGRLFARNQGAPATPIAWHKQIASEYFPHRPFYDIQVSRLIQI